MMTARQQRYVELAICAAVCIIGLGIRVHRIGDRSLWEDELSTWNSTRGSVMDGIRYIQMPHPPLYSLCCRLVGGGPIPSEARLRWPAAIFGTLAAVAGAVLARLLFGNRIAMAVLFSLCVHAFLVRYSREARMYSLLVLTSTLSMIFTYQTITTARRRDQAGLLISTTLLLYTHYFAALVLAAQVLWLTTIWWLAPRSADAMSNPDTLAKEPVRARGTGRPVFTRPPPNLDVPGFRRWAVATAGAVLLFAPMGIFFILRIMPNKLGWIQPAAVWRYVAALGDFVASWPGRAPGEGDAERFSSLLIGAAVMIVITLGVLLLVVGSKRSTEGRPAEDGRALRDNDLRIVTDSLAAQVAATSWLTGDVSRTMLLVAWLSCVLGGLAVISAASSPVFVPRYAISALVPATILVLALTDRMGRHVLPIATACIIGLNATSVTWERIREPASPNGLKAIIGFLRREATVDDAVVLVDFPFCPNWKNPVVMGFEYYGWREDVALLRVLGDHRSGRIVDDAALSDPRTLHLITLLGDVDEALARHGRVWQTLMLPPYRLVQVAGADGRRSSAWLEVDEVIARMGLDDR